MNLTTLGENKIDCQGWTDVKNEKDPTVKRDLKSSLDRQRQERAKN